MGTSFFIFVFKTGVINNMHLSPSYNYASGDLGMFMMVYDG